MRDWKIIVSDNITGVVWYFIVFVRRSSRHQLTFIRNAYLTKESLVDDHLLKRFLFGRPLPPPRCRCVPLRARRPQTILWNTTWKWVHARYYDETRVPPRWCFRKRFPVCQQIGIIGGSGLDDPDFFEDATERKVNTPYGEPSDSLVCGKLNGVECVLLAR